MKKTLLLTFIIGFVLTSCQEEQSGFEITANIKGLSENAKVVLSETESQKILDSAFVKNDSFKFKGYLDNTPIEISIVILPTDNNGQAKYTSIFMGNEIIEITGLSEEFSSNLKIRGSEFNKLKIDLAEKSKPANAEYDQNFEKMISIRKDGNWNDSLQNAYWGKNGIFDNIDNQLLKIKKEFVEKNLNTHFGLRQLYRLREDVPNEYLKSQFQKVKPDLKNTEYAKSLQIYLDSEPLKENDAFYNFKAENQNGEIVEFANYFNDNRYVLLEFYSPHCGWCKMALPEIKELAESKKDSLKVITFNVDKDKNDWLKTNKSNNISWESLWDENGRYSETFVKYRVAGTPTYYLFDNKGKIVKKWTGFDKKTTVENIKQRIK
ncbi:redoxin domain-containing protein [Gelidibacter maritimus]|uniref:Redoxin domain-containing protein n=1 Tax=Gelidibacter maritimus TaxID=2761487 RepID=A0A7W2M969_9FLAO|nr:thioredoxin-like domain-containing protein [Gelidibacter maritimus]MBA6154851.1 redoxin domain-containing protein [Gelidibacter maritimus]